MVFSEDCSNTSPFAYLLMKMFQKPGKFLFLVDFIGFLLGLCKAMFARYVVQIVLTCLYGYFFGLQHFYQVSLLTCLGKRTQIGFL